MQPRTGAAHGADARIRIGMIGCGQRGRQHLHVLRRLQADGESVEIAAACDVYDPSLDEARALTGCRTYRHWRDLLDHPGLDAVIIAAPDHWHAAMGIAAVQAGKDVFCETPMALSVEEAAAFRKVVRDSGRVVRFNVPQFHDPRWRAVQNFVRWGAAGSVRWIQCNCGNSRGAAASNADAADFMPERLDWEGFLGPAPSRPFSADRFFDWWKYWDYSHGVCAPLLFNHLAVILHALGDAAPLLVSSAGGIFAHGEQETPDAVLSNVECAGGTTVVLVAGPANGSAPITVIRGRDACVELRGDVLRVTPERERRRPVRIGASETSAVQKIAGKKEYSAPEKTLKHWIDAVRTRSGDGCNVDTACHAQTALCMAMDAYRRGVAIRAEDENSAAVTNGGQAVI